MHVVAAAIRDAQGRVLIAQRRSGTHLAGRWEFPGGKVEPGETRIEALARELAEEVGVALLAAHPLIRIHHAYPDRDIDLDVWVVTDFEGEAQGLEGQPLRWCPPDELPAANLLPADRPIVTALTLPETISSPEGRHYVIGAARGGQLLRGAFCATASQARDAVAAGADFLLVSHLLDRGAIGQFVADLNVPVYVRDIAPETAWESGASGIHTLEHP